MSRKSVLLVSFATCLLMASTASADGKHDATDVIGKRFKLTMKSEVQYVGVITQINEDSVVLADVSIIGETERGVPFLSNKPYVDRLFKNVGMKEKKLEYGIVIPLHEIESWEAIEAADSKNRPKVQTNELRNQATRLKRMINRLFQETDLSTDDRREIIKEIDLFRELISKE